MSRPTQFPAGVILALSRQGLTADQISTRLGCSRATVYHRLEQAGVSAVRRRSPVGSMIVLEVACDLIADPRQQDVVIARNRKSPREWVGQIRRRMESRGVIPVITRSERKTAANAAKE